MSWPTAIKNRKKSIPQIEHFSCRMCGHCCRSFTVNVTHFDVYRIYDNTQLEPIQFLYVSEPDKMDESESLQYTSGKKNLSLKCKVDQDDCIFLDSEELCSIHNFRPGVCRTWPFDFQKHQEVFWIENHLPFIKQNCAFNPQQVLDLDKINRDIELYNLEHELFATLIKEWNNKFDNEVTFQNQVLFQTEATLQKFIKFLFDKRPEEESKLEQLIKIK